MATPRRQLSWFDATSIIVGIIIGSGIYQTTPAIAGMVGNPSYLILAWLLGGAVAVLGALCYAELMTTFPAEGGDYVFLTKAYGRHAGFLFAWAEYWIVRPGNIGMMAFVFATFAQKLAPLPWGRGNGLAEVTYAALAVAALTCLNVLGVQTGKYTQNLLATAKVLGLAAVIGAGWFLVPATSAPPPVDPPGNFRLAMILVLFTYGGWSEVSYVAAELRNPERDLFRALLTGIGLVTVIYVAVNSALLRVLGLTAMASSNAVAVDLLAPSLGDWAGRLISLLICISSLGAINGMLFTGSRIYYAVGSEHRLVSWLGRWSGKLDAPVRSLSLQALITMGLIVGFGSYADGFSRLANFAFPVYWFFAFMVGSSLLVLRAKEPDRPRPHPAPAYPWIPLLFCLICAVLCESSFTYALSQGGHEAVWSLGLMLAGVLVTVGFDR